MLQLRHGSYLFSDAFKKTKDYYKQIDIVVNNAGIGDESNWDAMIDINLVCIESEDGNDSWTRNIVMNYECLEIVRIANSFIRAKNKWGK